MFTKEEIKYFIKKLGSKWLFPDFSNKITWTVLTFGGGFLLFPAPLKLLFINWGIAIFNLNSGIPLEIPDLEANSDYIIGATLVFLALAYNIGCKYFLLKKEIFEHGISEKLKLSDYKLLEKFISEFQSDSPSVRLLRDHDFENAFNTDTLSEIREFACKWVGAEYRFIDTSIERKREDLIRLCDSFLADVSTHTAPIGNGSFSSAIPENLKGVWNKPSWLTAIIDKLNIDAKTIYDTHQEFILLARNNL